MMEGMPVEQAVRRDGFPAPTVGDGEPPAVAASPLGLLVGRYDPTVLDGSQERACVRLAIPGEGEWDVRLAGGTARLEAATEPSPDATLTADREVWGHIANDLRGGMDAFRSGRLLVRRNLHLGVGFLASTSGMRPPEGLAFRRVETESGTLSVLDAGTGEPVILVHGLGATKISFLTTTVALAGAGYRTISVDLPGFGDSVKPLLAPYHPPFFARAIVDLMDALEIDRAHVIGNSMGGRVALELGLRYPDRARKLVLLAPSLAWKRERAWAPFVRLLRPELGLVQATPRWVIENAVHRIIPAAADGWVRAGVDGFLRAYLTPRGRVAFYASARNIYLEEPHGAKGFWTRLERLQAPSLFIWGHLDRLVPIGFAKHVEDVLPSASHLKLDCGHVPQLERPEETHATIEAFLRRPELPAELAGSGTER
ncbi:MAG: alpha/beta fold hydrolase [Deltaproteobacteria bacterium]|nr:alpha/beta fold hydrolase [Deltaproteobacteria bacterium]